MQADTQNVWISWTASESTAITDPFFQSRVQVSSAAVTDAVLYQWVNQQEQTAEMRRERAALAAADAQRHRDMHAAMQAASERAERLLEMCLSTAQRDTLTSHGWFEVRTASGRRYHIRRGRARNIVEVDPRGQRLQTWCCHPDAFVPDADTMLAQKLMLETQEDEFLRLANAS